MKTIGGFVCIRNGNELDYCFEEAVKSLLPICDNVLISDCDSTDGTITKIAGLYLEHPKVSFCQRPWTDPAGDPWWWVEWLNETRKRLSTDYCIYLDADEVFHEDAYPLIREAADTDKVLLCRRLNFWRDAKHLIPEGKCCSAEVIRVGPQPLWFPSDYPDPRAEELQRRAVKSNATIFHYGFIRRREAWFKKARVVQRIWANSYDPRLEAAEKYEGNWAEMPGVTSWEDQLADFSGTHPRIAWQWLKDRNYPIDDSGHAL